VSALFAVLAQYRADQPDSIDGVLTAEADLTDAWQTVTAGLRRRWERAVDLGSEAELADTMRTKLASVGREGGKQPLLAAATVALLVEVGELASDENNGTALCWVDMDTGTLTAEGGGRWAALASDVSADDRADLVSTGGAGVVSWRVPE
jgi:hypothetical protein